MANSTPNPRRTFLNALGAGVSGVALASAAAVTEAADPLLGKGRVFEGTSKKGDLEEALGAAIQAAMATARGNDRQVRWTLKSISGVNGGVVGAHSITVAIEAGIA